MKSIYQITILLFALLSASQLVAQTQPTESFTLQQCLEYALKNSVNAQNSVIDQQIATARVKETVGLGLPQINGNVSLTSNPILRRFFGLYPTIQGFSGVDANRVPNLQVPNASATDVLAEQSFFQLKNSGDAGLSINQLIFSGSYLVGLQAAKAFKDVSIKTTNQTKEQIIQQVIKAYYAVLINKERVKLFTSNIGRVDSLLKNTIELNKNGFSESIDVDRIQVTLNNLTLERDKFINIDELSLVLLKFQMGYPLDRPINVEGNIQEVQIESDMESYKQDWDYKNRPDYKVLDANKRLQELTLKNQYASVLPVISANASTGMYTQARTFDGLFRTNTTNLSGAYVTNGTTNGLGGNRWYNYQTIGVTASMSIFTGFQRSARIQQEKLRLAKIENSYRSIKQGADLEVEQSTVNFNNALKTLTSQKSNMDLASKVAKVTKIKYEQGIGSNLEVVTAEDSLRQAQTNYYAALFDVMIAKTDLEKAYGKLLPMYSNN